MSDSDEAVKTTGENVTHGAGIEKFSVIDTRDFASDLHVPMDDDKYADVAGAGDEAALADRALEITGSHETNCSDEPLSSVQEGPRVIIEVVNKVSVECGSCSAGLPPEICPGTEDSVAEVKIPSDSVAAAADSVREERDTMFLGSQSSAKCSGDEADSCSLDLRLEIGSGSKDSVAEVKTSAGSVAAAVSQERCLMFSGSQDPAKCTREESGFFSSVNLQSDICREAKDSVAEVTVPADSIGAADMEERDRTSVGSQSPAKGSGNESGFCSVDLRPEICCEAQVSVVEVKTPVDSVAAAVREEGDPNTHGSQSHARCSGDEFGSCSLDLRPEICPGVKVSVAEFTTRADSVAAAIKKERDSVVVQSRFQIPSKCSGNETGSCSLDLRPEVCFETKDSVAEITTPADIAATAVGEKRDAAAVVREEGETTLCISQSPAKRSGDESGFSSADSRPEICSETSDSVAEAKCPADSVAVACREERDTMFCESQSPAKCSEEESGFCSVDPRPEIGPEAEDFTAEVTIPADSVAAGVKETFCGSQSPAKCSRDESPLCSVDLRPEISPETSDSIAEDTTPADTVAAGVMEERDTAAAVREEKESTIYGSQSPARRRADESGSYSVELLPEIHSDTKDSVTEVTPSADRLAVSVGEEIDMSVSGSQSPARCSGNEPGSLNPRQEICSETKDSVTEVTAPADSVPATPKEERGTILCGRQSPAKSDGVVSGCGSVNLAPAICLEISGFVAEAKIPADSIAAACTENRDGSQSSAECRKDESGSGSGDLGPEVFSEAKDSIAEVQTPPDAVAAALREEKDPTSCGSRIPAKCSGEELAFCSEDSRPESRPEIKASTPKVTDPSGSVAGAVREERDAVSGGAQSSEKRNGDESGFGSVDLRSEICLQKERDAVSGGAQSSEKCSRDESGFGSVDLRPEIYPQSSDSVAGVKTPTDSVAAAAGEERETIAYVSRSPGKWSGSDEISHVGQSVSSYMQPPVVCPEKSGSSALPVAIRTLPLVPYRETVHEQRTDAFLLTSCHFEERRLHNEIVTSTVSVEFPEGECASADELALGKAKSGAEVESRDRLGVFRGADTSVSADMILTHADFKDFCNTTALVDSGEDTFTVEAGGNEIAVAVKKKLQTKRKKVTDQNIEAEKSKSLFGFVLGRSRLEEATSTKDSSALLKNAEIHGPEDVSRSLNETRVLTVEAETPAECRAIGVGLFEADGIEGIRSSLSSGDQAHGHLLMCHCKKPAVLKTVGYKNKNRGLRYYSCERYKPTFFTKKRNRKLEIQNLMSCRFFKWLDTPRVTVEDKKDIRLPKKRQLEQILAAKAVNSCSSTRPSSSKHEFLDYEAQKIHGFLQGVTPVSGLSEEPKLKNSEQPKQSTRKKRKLNKMIPSLSTADCVAFSTRASAARKRKGPCVSDDKNVVGSSSCGGKSSRELSPGDWTDSHPGKVAKRGSFEEDKTNSPAHTYSRRAKSSPPLRLCAFKPRPKSVGKLERATADTNHVRKLLPVSLAYQKSREVVLEESSEEDEVNGDHEEESSEEGNFLGISSPEEECVDTPSSISVERMQVDVKSPSRAHSETRSTRNGTRAKSIEQLENSVHSVCVVPEHASGPGTSHIAENLGRNANRQPRWLDVPLTSPFESKTSSITGVSGHEGAQYEFDQRGEYSGNHGVIVNFPTPSKAGGKQTVSSNTLLIVKEKAREASLAVSLRKKEYLSGSIDCQTMARVKPASELQKRSEREHVSDSDSEETGPKGYRGHKSLKEMLSREDRDGAVAHDEVADAPHLPFCECKTARRRAVLKTVVSNSPNQGLRYWVCVNHRPLYRKKNLWKGDPEDESCKFFRWLDTPGVINAEGKKKIAARRRRN